MFRRVKAWAQALRREVIALYLAARDPRTPWWAKAVAAAVAAYALSPIDLIPDFIPVLGYLDDLLIVPLGIMLAIRLVPADVLADCRREAAARDGLPKSWRAAAVIGLVWLVAAALVAAWLWGVVS